VLTLEFLKNLNIAIFSSNKKTPTFLSRCFFIQLTIGINLGTHF